MSVDQPRAGAAYGTAAPPFHYALKLPAMLGGPDPLDGISVYRSSAFGRRVEWIG